jgi:hypothetical protein
MGKLDLVRGHREAGQVEGRSAASILVSLPMYDTIRRLRQREPVNGTHLLSGSIHADSDMTCAITIIRFRN